MFYAITISVFVGYFIRFFELDVKFAEFVTSILHK